MTGSRRRAMRRRPARRSSRASRWAGLGTPEEIAAMALYLAGDKFAFTTGQIHVVDGGISI